jgi:hypothetical protein
MKRSSDELDAIQNQMPLRRATLRSGAVRVMTQGVRELRRFRARGTSGKVYVITETVDLHDIRTHDNLNAPPMEGLRSLHTTEGHSINFLGAGRYQIVETGEVLTEE